MANRLLDEDVPYRSFVGGTGPLAPENRVDEEDYKTLVVVKRQLDAELEALKTDYNAIIVPLDKPSPEAGEIVLRQIAILQGIHARIAPLAEIVDQSITTVDNKWKQR